MVEVVEPVIVVVEGAIAKVASVLRDECRVVVHHPGIHDSDYRSLSKDAEGRPDFISPIFAMFHSMDRGRLISGCRDYTPDRGNSERWCHIR